jgi:hypothetical protein
MIFDAKLMRSVAPRCVAHTIRPVNQILLLPGHEISFGQGPGLIYPSHLASRPPMSSGKVQLPTTVRSLPRMRSPGRFPLILALELYEVRVGDDNGKRLRSQS